MQSAVVFNIQKFSLNDGPGIRTVVFLKGCPLRCAWCANPESQQRAPQVEWDEGRCIGCGTCLRLCPETGGVTRSSKRHVDVRTLDGGSSCAQAVIDACPGDALTLVGESRTVDEVVRVCLQDQPFYEDSGGGVTLSGGDALLWPDFDIELLVSLQARGIDTCIETEAYASKETFQSVAAHLDHLLIDMKHWNSAAHKLGTGVGNELILANTRWAIAMGKDVLIRTPVIPGFNDAIEDARGMARTLREIGARRVQLLPFHTLGENKYDLLDRENALRGVRALGADDLADYRDAYIQEGVDAFF
jgi:pyruvate formate lyase activating enzyme